MVTGTVLVWLTEVTGNDWAVDRTNDLCERDVAGLTGQDIAATDAALGSDETSTLEGKENLLEVGLGQACAISNISNRGRSLSRAVKRK